MKEWSERFVHWMRLRNWTQATLETYGWGARDFLSFLESQGVDQISSLHRGLVESYRTDLFQRRSRGKPLAVSTQALRLTAVKAFLRFLAQENVLLLDVGAGVDLPKVASTLPRVMSEEETLQLLESPDVATLTGIRDRAVLEVLYSTAARNSEVGDSDLEDVVWDLPGLCIRQGKGQKGHMVPLGEEARAWLEEYLTRVRPRWLADPQENRLFLTPRGKRMKRDVLSTLVGRYAKALGLQGVTPHTLRHSAATHMLRRGANLRHLQEMLGHSSPLSTSYYTQVDLKDLRKALRRYHPREQKP